MKVLILTPYAEPEKGACTIRVNYLKNAFEKNKHDVTVLSLKRPNIGKSAFVKRYSGIINLVKIILSAPVDVVIGTSPPLPHNFFAMFACRLKGIKFVLDAKDDIFVIAPPEITGFTNFIKRKIYFFLRKLTYQYSNHLFFLTEDDLIVDKKKYALNPKKLSIVGNGSDTKIVYFDSVERSKTRKKLGVNSNEKVIVYAGAVSNKQVLEYVQAISEDVLIKGYFLIFLLTIDLFVEEKFLSIKKLISEKGIQDKVFVATNVNFNELYKFFSAADVSVVPISNTLITCIPIKVFDYFAAGLPVVFKGPAKGPSFRMFKSNSFLGKYVTSLDSIPSAIGSVFESGLTRKKFQKKRVDFVESFYDRKINSEKAVRLVEKIVKGELVG